MREPLVSICIPTYNRCDYLERSLISLISQEDFLNGNVEIVISDNASDDNTQKMVEKLAAIYDNLRFFRNKENIGGDENPKLVTGLGQGKLLKLCNDDLIYEDSALKLFCHYAEKYSEEKPQLYFANGIPSGNSFNGFRRVNFEYFMYSASYWVTWACTFSIWKTDLDKYYGNNIGIEKKCWQVGPCFDVLDEKDNGVIIGDCFATRAKLENKNLTYDMYQVFYVNFLSMLEPFREKGKISQSCMEWIRHDLLLNFFPYWVAAQELGVEGFKFYHKPLKIDVVRECETKTYYDIYLRNYNRMLDELQSECNRI